MDPGPYKYSYRPHSTWKTFRKRHSAGRHAGRAASLPMPAIPDFSPTKGCGRVGNSDVLTQLALKHGTDKARHGFTRHYNSFFCKARFDVLRVLEVGVFGGASIKMWHE